MFESKEVKSNECIIRGVVSADKLDDFLLKLELSSAPHLSRCVYMNEEAEYIPDGSHKKVYCAKHHTIYIQEIKSCYLSDDSILRQLETTPSQK